MGKRESDTDTDTAYVLGHSEDELARLGRQAKLVDPITRHFFERAGIAPGMRVLDIGSGVGHVAFLAADMVGEKGSVTGVDRAPPALEAARAGLEARGLRNVTFLEGDPSRMTFEVPFDAVIGRYVLMFQPDPVSMLRSIAKHVTPGGIVVFHEPDWEGVQTFPHVPLYETACRWIVDTIEKNGADSRMGGKLQGTFLAAGLPAPAMGLEALIGGGEDMERIRFITEIVGTLRELIERSGVASASEIGLETLHQRIAADAIAKGAVLISRSEIGAWSRRS